MVDQKRFDIALSFPGERRSFVKVLAQDIASKINKDKVFYDEWHKAELAKPDADIEIQNIYLKESKLIVVFLCKEYDSKEWCGLELRAIRELIKTKRSKAIMLMRFDETDISGLYSGDGYIDVNNHQPLEIVNLILERLKQINSQSAEKIDEQVETDELASAKGIDYRNLKNLIVQKKWVEADIETVKIMCELMHREVGKLRKEDIEKLPDTDLKTIDNLWRRYSNEIFGFSVQKEIWMSFDRPHKFDQNWENFIQQIGWNKDILNEELSPTPPKGHFPRQLKWVKFSVLASRI